MQKITNFFWQCSGADLTLLQKCPTESSKYLGIGATIFFTGLFAAMSGAYALYTVFDSIIIAVIFGLIWGLMIFNWTDILFKYAQGGIFIRICSRYSGFCGGPNLYCYCKPMERC